MRALLAFQGLFYFLTGIWPIVHMVSFLQASGVKTDLWLVNTVGALLAVSGLAFIFSASKNDTGPGIRAVAMGEAAALTAIDVTYVYLGTIPDVYLADAIAEVCLIAAWVWLITRKPRA